MNTGRRAGEGAPRFRVLKSRDYRRMPWKNGGGQTIEIAIFPEGASLGDFDWRVSMARVESDGAFSIFPGTDRSLAILQGFGMELAIAPHPAVQATISTPPLAFDAGAATRARLLDGPVLDLNLMTRRTRFKHRMTRIALAEPALIDLSGHETLVLAGDCGVRIETAAGGASLEPRDTLQVTHIGSPVRLVADRPGLVYLLEIFAVADA